MNADVDDLLAISAAGVQIGGSGALSLTGYTGQDLSDIIGSSALLSNTLTASLDVDGTSTVLSSANLGDVTKITQLSVGDSEAVTLSADLASLM